MEPVKVVIFIAFFGFFLIIVRALFSNQRTDPRNIIPPQPWPDEPEENDKEPVLTGYDMPFPIAVPPRVLRADGTCNRPEITNYFFGKIDLARSPEDSRAFCDEFTIQFEIPETSQKWFAQYTVATPAGLEKLVNSQKSGAVMMEHTVIIIPRWDLAAVLQVIVDAMMESWALPDSAEMENFIDDPSQISSGG